MIINFLAAGTALAAIHRSLQLVRKEPMLADLESHSSVFAAAAGWLQGTLLGAVATTVAVIAVAWLGFLMLTGRVDVRRAAQVVLGCFIIFGASTIANGIFGAAPGIGTNSELAQAPSPPPTLPTPPAYPNANSSPFDPYAGAALPQR